jgi:DNA-binding LacI/PurR family transcriptional regulator
MLRAAAAHGQVLSIEAVAVEGDALPLFVRESVVDGLIAFEALPPRIEQAIARHGIPLVEVNTCRRDRPNAIVMDEAGAMELAVQHLAAGRRKQIALILAEGEALHERERIAALRRACAQARLSAPLLLPFAGVSTTQPEGQRHLEAFFAAHPACDAVIAPHDAFVGMVYGMCQRQGRRIPHDLAVACMQNPDRLLHLVPPVTAFDLPEALLGELAVELLQQLVATRVGAPARVLPYGFFARASTA